MSEFLEKISRLVSAKQESAAKRAEEKEDMCIEIEEYILAYRLAEEKGIKYPIKAETGMKLAVARGFRGLSIQEYADALEVDRMTVVCLELGLLWSWEVGQLFPKIREVLDLNHDMMSNILLKGTRYP